MQSYEILLIILGAAAAVGLFVGKAVQLTKLPAIIGYMLLGVAVGLSGLRLLNEENILQLTFVTDIALGFVAFVIGAELNIQALKRQSKGVVAIIFVESFGAFAVVLGAMFLLTRDLPLSLVFAAVAPASAPAGTVAVIRECRARGSLTKVLFAVVGFDDALAIFIYAFAAAVARFLLTAEAGGSTGAWYSLLLGPAKEIGFSLLIGGVIGFVFNFLVARLKGRGETLILVFGAVAAGVGLSLAFSSSLILTNMIIGLILANARSEGRVRKIMEPVGNVMPLLFLMFFVLAGAQLDLVALPALGLIGLVYIFSRSAGLLAGSRLGARIGGAEDKVRKYVGLGILSQAGVAIGLSLMAKQQFAEVNTVHALAVGATLITTVMATSVVFEVIGPILTRIALKKAGEIEQDRPAASDQSEA
ncbi:MAG: cation:proton antiporter [Spirochaetia bacterium]